MEFGYHHGIKSIKAELPTSYNPNIRLFNVTKATSPYPQDECHGIWAVCDSNTLKTFSAVGYFFGKKLNRDLNVPIGLINSSWGGTPAEAWTPEEVITAEPELKAAANKLTPAAWWPHQAGYSYNAMIAPLTNYSISGAIWYQGESNTGTASTYKKLFTAMIEGWRKQWGKDLPFYYVQIAPYKYGNNYVGALLREAQTEAMGHSNVGMVVITDLVDDTNDIHPANKHDVGYRLANWALAETYHKENIAYKSPVYKAMSIHKGKAILTFNHLKTGLRLREKKIRELYVAGNDRTFYPAEARLEKDKLIVWSKEVPEPVAVRYAFSNTAIGNIFSSEGLPLAPFRTDNWDVQTGSMDNANHPRNLMMETKWMGFNRKDFRLSGRQCTVVEPRVAASGKPWIWRTEFFGHEPQADTMLLSLGYHLAYMDLRDMYGAPVALRLMDTLYQYLTLEQGLSKRVVLEGFSRGGLFAFNWAAKNPGLVSCIYVDAPVCDFKSWPAGKGKGVGSPEDWTKLKKAYRFETEKEAVNYKFNPVDNLKPLAASRIPIIAVCGQTDDVVPMDENINIIEKEYKKLGGTIKVIAKPNNGHHPHSLKDPAPIVDFILENAIPG
jgi:sialate O-acetylesterase